MVRMIDIDKAREEYRNLIDLTMSDTTLLHTLYSVLDTAPTVEAILKDQYEARLKADLVAILTEIQLEIEELDNPLDYDFEGYNQCAVDCEKLIQQKISSLKENKDGENNN